MLAPDMVVKFNCNTRPLTLSFREVPIQAWFDVKRACGFTPLTLVDALKTWDMEALAALIWLERKQRERRLTWPEFVKELESSIPELEVTDLIANGESMMGTGDTGETEPDPTEGS